MAIDKTKVALNAQKLVQKGQLDKAIKEYQLLVEADPKDIRSLLKIAELYGRLNQKSEAIKTFRRVADQYNKSGFFTKAVAVLRQAIEVDAKQVDLYTFLAELYQKLGLNKDALMQLNTASRLLQEEGKHTQALELMERMREFDREDPSILARYGEALFNAGQKDKAVGIFRSLIANLKQTNNHDDLIRFCERILTINPDDVESLKDLSRAYVKVGLGNKALLRLKALFDRNILDAELYDLLDRSYSLLRKEDKAVHAQVEKAKYWLAQGRADEAKRTYEHVLEREPNNAEAVAYLRPSGRQVAPPPRRQAPPAPSLTPAPAARPAPMARAATSEPSTASKQLSKFLTEADVYLKYGLRDKAIEQLENVLQHDANNIAARRKLVDIYVEESPVKAAGHLRALAEISESLGEVEQARVYWKRAEELDAPKEMDAPKISAAASAAVDDLLLDSDDDVGATESGFIDEDEVTIESSVDDDEEVDIEVETEEEAGEEETAEFLDDEMGDLGIDDAEETSGVLDIGGGGQDLSEELDEAEFYIQQNIFPEAKAIYERILERAPGHPGATSKLRWVEEQMGAKAPAPKAAAKAPAAKPAPAHAPAEAEPMFDLAAELEEELDFQDAAMASAEADEPPSFEDIFSQFKKGVERELKDDAAAHYDLGIAYKEMGLVKDAVGEFEIALKSPGREVESANMIAVCYQELGEPAKAVEYYQRALVIDGCPPEAALNMNYELACLYEETGDVRNAVMFFKKVVDQDKVYRDVAEKIRALKARVQAGKAYA